MAHVQHTTRLHLLNYPPDNTLHSILRYRKCHLFKLLVAKQQNSPHKRLVMVEGVDLWPRYMERALSWVGITEVIIQGK